MPKTFGVTPVTLLLKWRNSLENGLVMKKQSRTFKGKGGKKKKQEVVTV